MASVNAKTKSNLKTHEGGAAKTITAAEQLRRIAMANMLWENQFYVDGKSTAELVGPLVHKLKLEDAAQIAIDARDKMKLRHMPLLIVREMARHPALKHSPGIVSATLQHVIQRADEITEFLAIYWKDGKQSLSAQVKKGLAAAFAKFNEYELAKYNRDKTVTLRDALFLSHAKPADVTADMAKWDKAAREQYRSSRPKEVGGFAYAQIVRPEGFTPGEQLFDKLVTDTLTTPDTWESQLSAGADKKQTFTRLMAERKLGALAFLRNLRNMRDAKVDRNLIETYAKNLNVERVLPFRYIAAARATPEFEPMLEPLMLRCLEGMPKLRGITKLYVDVSGSMNSAVSGRSELTRLDAAKGLAILLREVCEHVDVYVFNSSSQAVPARRGFALGDAIGKPRGGTDVAQVVQHAENQEYDRLIVITDEQSATRVPDPTGVAYMINVAAYRNGVGYGRWHHIDGWSEAIVDYIMELEGVKTSESE
jgi:60 kDa SS-A/Ro ribonucleoprotein